MGEGKNIPTQSIAHAGPRAGASVWRVNRMKVKTFFSCVGYSLPLKKRLLLQTLVLLVLLLLVWGIGFIPIYLFLTNQPEHMKEKEPDTVSTKTILLQNLTT